MNQKINEAFVEFNMKEVYQERFEKQKTTLKKQILENIMDYLFRKQKD